MRSTLLDRADGALESATVRDAVSSSFSVKAVRDSTRRAVLSSMDTTWTVSELSPGADTVKAALSAAMSASSAAARVTR